ncbi:MAG: dihydrodipicolinate reductase [Desulfobacteraceae bacterium]|nr:MAG: dihydrodipicolinate reductase [Desulfobacteraceae bacterium]
MTPTQIMVNGLPGNVAIKMATHARAHDRFQLLPWSLTGPDVDSETLDLDNFSIALIRPELADSQLGQIKADHDPLIIDYTHPSAVNQNAELYVKHGIPFVMGTTGGDRKALVDTVTQGDTPAVIAPNMMKQIVGLMAMFEYGATHFPDLFKGFTMRVKESHQKGKADTSGTAKAMISYFNQMGIDFSTEEIMLERDPERQKNLWDIPDEHLGGHGYHTYSISAGDESSFFEITHNINGRDVYVPGTYDAVDFLINKLNDPENRTGHVYTMIDVLKKN